MLIPQIKQSTLQSETKEFHLAGPSQHAFSAVSCFIEHSPPLPKLRLTLPFSFLKVSQGLLALEGEVNMP